MTPLTHHKQSLDIALDYCRRYLPHQGRLEDFIHHNTLHAFTDRSFDAAVCEASALYGTLPYPKLRDYHQWMDAKEINKDDLLKIIEHEVPGILTTDFQIGTVTLSATELLQLLMSESAPFKFPFFEIYGQKFRGAEKVFRKWNRTLLKLADQGHLDIWVPHLIKRTFFEQKSRIFHEALDETYGLVLRCLSAYFDQGISQIKPPKKEEGLLPFFFTYFQRPLPLSRNWRKLLSRNIKVAQERSSLDILLGSLNQMGIPPEEWKHYLFSLLYRFKGWSAFILAKHDNALFEDFATLVVLCDLSQTQDHYKSQSKKIEALGKSLPTLYPVRKIYENNLRGIIRHLLNRRGARHLLKATEEELLPLFRISLTFHNFFKRQLYQKVLDQKSERDFLGAVLSCKENRRVQEEFIALFCIDEREESFRRHLEECEPHAQTEGTAGHFGLNIEFRGYRRSHYRKLCPAPQTPLMRIKEAALPSPRELILNRLGQTLFWIERALLHPIYGMAVTLVLSPVISATLLLRIFFPTLYLAIKSVGRRMFFTQKWQSTFILEPKDPADEESLVKAMAETLISCGLKNITVPYLFIVGHGSTSLNNPHEAAHDCGACAGGRGAANARLFAQLASRAEARKTLAAHGVMIHPDTQFIGTYHNTSSDDVDFMNLPEEIPSDLGHYIDMFRLAANRNASERSRRFLDHPIPTTPKHAKMNMVHRSLELNQVRPEYGHATNAYLVIGPRDLTRGLFMDRRAFLCSYRHQDDPDGRYLKGILCTVVPVCVGINLEYYFSWVDRQGYGCDTKIPHNINGLNGVMNGFMSDLLLGLPLQMTEIHRPVRLKVLLQAPLPLVKSLLKELPEISQEIHNEWFYFSVLDSETKNLFSWAHESFEKVSPICAPVEQYQNSLEFIQGHRDYIGFATRRESP